MTRPAIKISSLRHEYAPGKKKKSPVRKAALDGIDFEVAAGEMFGLLGPNGSGKTTLFRILSTALFPTSGEVVMAGHNLRTEASLIREKMGVVFQSPCLDARLTVRENLIHQGYVFGLCGAGLKKRVDEMMENLKIEDYAQELAGSLSGGLKRRTELAKGLLHKPEILLLDEPSTGLDPGARMDLWRYLKSLREETGLTLLVTTHLMEEAEQCSRVGILQAGKLVRIGAPAELKREVRGDVISVRSRDAEKLKKAVLETFQLDARLIEDELQIEHAEGARFVARLVEAFPGMIESVTFRKPTLEDVFIHHTGHRFWNETEGVRP